MQRAATCSHAQPHALGLSWLLSTSHVCGPPSRGCVASRYRRVQFFVLTKHKHLATMGNRSTATRDGAVAVTLPCKKSLCLLIKATAMHVRTIALLEGRAECSAHEFTAKTGSEPSPGPALPASCAVHSALPRLRFRPLGTPESSTCRQRSVHFIPELHSRHVVVPHVAVEQDKSASLGRF